MTIGAEPARRALDARRALRAHLDSPLLRDGYALVLNTGLTSVMGITYWLLAAHAYPTRTVGIDTAAISAMMFLAGIAQLNLMSAMLRFIPIAGARARRLVVSWYAIALSLAAAAGIVFVVGVPAWAPALSFLRDPWFTVWFVAATMAWCIFNLQDSVLISLGRAVLVPVENQVFSTAKIVLLLGFAALSPHHGIFASWTAGLIFSLVPVNVLLFRRFLPAHARDEGPHVRPASRRDVTRFVSADYVASLCWLAATFLMPVLVIGLEGAKANAWFSLAWMVAWPLFAISINTGAALVVAGARDEARLGRYVRQVRRQTLLLVAPLALLLAATAPLVLRLFGASYAAGASGTLRLLCLAAIPNVVVALAVSQRRVTRRMRQVVGVVASQCGLVLALSLVLLPRSGVAGVGLAWLVASTTVATVVLLADHGRPALVAAAARARDVAADTGALRLLQWVRAAVPQRRRTRRVADVAPAILAGTPWTPHGRMRTVSDMAVLTAGPAEGVPCAIVKYATTPAAARSLETEWRTLTALWADARLVEWRTLLPVVLAHGEQAGAPYVVEELLPGRPATGALASCPERHALIRDAAQAIGDLHRVTAAELRVDEDRLRRWVDDPLRALGPDGDTPHPVSGPAIAALAGELRELLADRPAAVSWVHGDYVPENILWTGRGSRVTGIVDWELARPADLPLVDVVTLLLATRMRTARRELGRVVCDWLAGARWTAFEEGIIREAYAGLPGEPVDERALVLLAWLRHVAGNVTKAPRYATLDLWRLSNVEPVARAVAGPS
jgi:aminoglycoside phosphotransferase (APT) family kinase protein/O-antigen/teichoic acid export membrane protein